MLLAFVLVGCLAAQDETWAELRAEAFSEQKKLCAIIDSLFSGVEVVELVSLDPFPPMRKPEDSGDHVGMYRVRKRFVLRDRDAISKIAASLEASITEDFERAFRKEGDMVFPTKCFFPQHAFRMLSDGKEVYVLVGSLCGNGVIWGLDESGMSFQVSHSWFEYVESVFSKSGLPPSEKQFLRRTANRVAGGN